jgi:uncharacterized membrane protein YgcG
VWVRISQVSVQEDAYVERTSVFYLVNEERGVRMAIKAQAPTEARHWCKGLRALQDHDGGRQHNESVSAVAAVEVAPRQKLVRQSSGWQSMSASRSTANAATTVTVVQARGTFPGIGGAAPADFLHDGIDVQDAAVAQPSWSMTAGSATTCDAAADAAGEGGGAGGADLGGGGERGGGGSGGSGGGRVAERPPAARDSGGGGEPGCLRHHDL